MAPPASPDPALSLALAVVDASNAPLVLLDGELNVVAASATFRRAFGLEGGELAGASMLALGAGEWSVPQFAALLRATLSGRAAVDAYEMDLKRPGLPTRRLVLNAHKLTYDDAGSSRLLLSILDVTEARLAAQLKDDMVREKAILLDELQHRVANSLQIIASILLQTARSASSPETREHLSKAHHRVMSIAEVQKKLSTSPSGLVGLNGYLTDLCRSIGASMIRDPALLVIEVRVDGSAASADTSVSLGLIATELVINALKHGFPDQRSGTICVDYSSQGTTWRLSVSDDGVGMAGGPSPGEPGLGTTIVEALAKQLRARVAVSDNHPGTHVAVTHA